LLTQFIKTIPDELIENVLLESNSHWNIIRIVVIPMTKNGIIALIILNFAENWNMVEQPLVMLEDNTKHPLSVALNSIMESDISVAIMKSMKFKLHFRTYV